MRSPCASPRFSYSVSVASLFHTQYLWNEERSARALDSIRFVEPTFCSRNCAPRPRYRITANGIHASTMTGMRPITPRPMSDANTTFTGRFIRSLSFAVTANAFRVHFASEPSRRFFVRIFDRSIKYFSHCPKVGGRAIIATIMHNE